MTLKTGFVGLGAMGAPMARNLHAAGLLAAVYNRSRSRAEALAEELGCAAPATLEALARDCQIVVLCVSADRDVLDCVNALLPGLAPGSIVIDCSTVSAQTARDAAATLRTADCHFLDCPVSGGTEGAAKGTLAIMCGGGEAAFERARPVLDAMGKTVSLMGPAGSGQATKAVNQIMVAGINQAVAEALAFARAEGLPLDKVIDVVGGGAAGNWFLTHRGPNMVRGKFPLGFKVALHQKDLGIVQRMAEAHDVQLPVVEMTRLHYERLLQAGHADHDISSLMTVKDAMFDPD